MDDIILHTFQAAKWLPETLSVENQLPQSPANWLPTLAKYSPLGRRQTLRSSWFEDQLAAGAQLTTTLPNSELISIDKNRWGLSHRLYWWPCGIPAQSFTAIISSRLGRRLHEYSEWFEAFRAVCKENSARRRVFVFGENTTTARFIKRAAALFGLPTLVVHEPRVGKVNSWLRHIARTPQRESSHYGYEVFVSPVIARSDFEDPLEHIPIRDRLVVAMADELIAIHLRRRGNLEKLIRKRLADLRKSAPVTLITGERLVPPALAQELQALGAIEWLGAADSSASHAQSIPSADRSQNTLDLCVHGRITRGAIRIRPFRAPVVSWSSFLQRTVYREWRFLTHCTRAPDGPWPDQTEDQFVDELILGLAKANRTPLASLVRIVSQRRVLASGSGLRGGTPVVCFTEVPLGELHLLRTFQPQRHRWDFEPYGICIAREWLVQRGARAVRYGDDDTWLSLPESERPFFQLRATRRAKRQRYWIQEREWRHLGDVDLNQVPGSDAFLFVPDSAAAEPLRSVSRWPIVICRSGS